MEPTRQPGQNELPPEEEVVLDELPEQAELDGVEDATAPQAVARPLDESDSTVAWTAQEYIHPDKSPLWFIVFVVVVLGLVALDIFLLQSWTFSALVIVAAIAVIIYTRRPPRMLSYGLSGSHGFNVGDRLYHFEEFKAFGIIRDGEHNSIMLLPRRRFAPGVSVYFPDEAGEKIVDILGQRLPMEDLKLDLVDQLIRKLRL